MEVSIYSLDELYHGSNNDKKLFNLIMMHEIYWFWNKSVEPWKDQPYSIRNFLNWVPYPIQESELAEKEYQTDKVEFSINSSFLIDQRDKEKLVQINKSNSYQQRPILRISPTLMSQVYLNESRNNKISNKDKIEELEREKNRFSDVENSNVFNITLLENKEFYEKQKKQRKYFFSMLAKFIKNQEEMIKNLISFFKKNKLKDNFLYDYIESIIHNKPLKNLTSIIKAYTSEYYGKANCPFRYFAENCVRKSIDPSKNELYDMQSAFNILMFNEVFDYRELKQLHFEGIVYRGIFLSPQDFEIYKSLRKKKINERKYGLISATVSTSKNEKAACHFLTFINEKNEDFIPILMKIHVVQLAENFHKKFEKSFKIRINLTSTATDIHEISEFKNEDEVLLESPFFHLLDIYPECKNGKNIYICESVMVNVRRHYADNFDFNKEKEIEDFSGILLHPMAHITALNKALEVYFINIKNKNNTEEHERQLKDDIIDAMESKKNEEIELERVKTIRKKNCISF